MAGEWQSALVEKARGGVTGPAGPAKAGPLFRGSLVSFSDCSDSLRTRRLGESPLLCVYAFLVIVYALLPVSQEIRSGPIPIRADRIR